MKKILAMAGAALSCLTAAGQEVSLTLLPPTPVSEQVKLDVRGGIRNPTGETMVCNASVYLNKRKEGNLLASQRITLEGGASDNVRTLLDLKGKAGRNKVIFAVEVDGKVTRKERTINVLPMETRYTGNVDGAWLELYSENGKAQKLTDKQWRELVGGLHGSGMNLIVIPEVFHCTDTVGLHDFTGADYPGQALYPSELYWRVPMAADDPLEAIFAEADRLGMQVMPGVGTFARFDFTGPSLAWHQSVARELWERYGHHDSFYGFYVSEGIGAGLDNGESDAQTARLRRNELISFFRNFRRSCAEMAPGKPVMLAMTGSDMGAAGEDAYLELLRNLDILCSTGLTDRAYAIKLQELCDRAGTHLWQKIFKSAPGDFEKVLR